MKYTKALLFFTIHLYCDSLCTNEIKKGYDIIESAELDERNYAKEYANYHSRPEQIANRSSRNKARRVMGDKAIKGMDVGHKDNNPMNNDPSNLRNEDPSINRKEPRLREVKQDSEIKDKKGTQPAKYYATDIAKSTKDKRAAHFSKKKNCRIFLAQLLVDFNASPFCPSWGTV